MSPRVMSDYLGQLDCEAARELQHKLYSDMAPEIIAALRPHGSLHQHGQPGVSQSNAVAERANAEVLAMARIRTCFCMLQIFTRSILQFRCHTCQRLCACAIVWVLCSSHMFNLVNSLHSECCFNLQFDTCDFDGFNLENSVDNECLRVFY